MNYLNITKDYFDPAVLPVEVVERKGVGHPDSLADALANEVSIAFSRECLQRYGLIPHHNVDKLYIGAGYYKNDYSQCNRLAPVVVRVNGRMTNTFGGEAIGIEEIQHNAVWNYLSKVLPRITPEDLIIDPNATQHTKVAHWFTPRDRADIPDADHARANDTSFCVGHWPPTLAEMLAYRLERYFWEPVGGFAIPRFPEIGQDIKVMVLRRGNELEAVLCVPTISIHTPSRERYLELIKYHEEQLTALVGRFAGNNQKIVVRVNPYQHQYMLGLGSCIECGEEGIVGRGNSLNGVISSHRVHTLESWAGKNPVYHTGRVMGYLVSKLSKSIAIELNVRCTVSALTRCGDTLLPPAMLHVATSNDVDPVEVERLVEKDMLSADYVQEILNFRPWMLEL
ncbi:hypothetical protein K2Q00_01105 [Patescibacteria group bacterium]|nr:hypothetical protein [Patescibacteria group bacterium]